MSTIPESDPATAELAASALSRKPRQERSRASFERMLAAARSLMLERGSEDFTLKDVSERGGVSIGSIYLRFESKDSLVHAVIAEELAAISADEDAMIEDLLARAPSLEEFVPLYVDRYAEVLAGHAPLLRMIMQRASRDPAVSGPGKETAARTAERSVAALLRYRGEMTAGDPERKARAAFQIIFSTIARHLSLGSTEETSTNDEFSGLPFAELQRELAGMCVAYLKG